MRYKAMAMRLRQATGTKDPKPTAALLDETPRHEAVAAILADETPVFSRVFAALEHAISPETVFLDKTKTFKNIPHGILKNGSRKVRSAEKAIARAKLEPRRKTRPEGSSRRRRSKK